MRLVVLESPYAGDVRLNVEYARACMRDCLSRDEAPYASHLLFTQEGILDDTVPEQRYLGIEAGLQWGAMADATVVYVDLGISSGMEQGITHAELLGRPVEYRSLYSGAAQPPATIRDINPRLTVDVASDTVSVYAEAS